MLAPIALPDISIHAPREGGDVQVILTFERLSISIHAPREGGDGVFRIFLAQNVYFNPRPPRGGRPLAPSAASSVCR